MSQPQFIPGEQPLSSALVVRAGQMELETVKVGINTNLDKRKAEHGHNGHLISVNSLPNGSVAEIMKLARKPHPDVRVTTAERVTQSGWKIAMTPNSATGHCDIWKDPVDQMPSDADLLALIAVFDEPITNPHRVQGRRR